MRLFKASYNLSRFIDNGSIKFLLNFKDLPTTKYECILRPLNQDLGLLLIKLRHRQVGRLLLVIFIRPSYSLIEGQQLPLSGLSHSRIYSIITHKLDYSIKVELRIKIVVASVIVVTRSESIVLFLSLNSLIELTIGHSSLGLVSRS